MAMKHEDKARICWEAFRERMGKIEFRHMYFDLSTILTQDPDLEWLERPFTKDEIDNIISDLPKNKSPGPDGFNGEFIAKCWHLISDDFYKLCEGFYERQVCVQSINASYITLIPKKVCPLEVADFRLTSLLNSTIKLITKILAQRL